VGGTLFFTATAPATGNELYRSDGTPFGTFLVRDIFPGATSSNPASLTPVGERLFFAATAPVVGRELFVLDLDETPAGDKGEGGIDPGPKAVRDR
jgi:ELWxxDGT repeat protein